MYNVTKKYYSNGFNNCSNSCSDTLSNPFLNQANLLLSLYYKHNVKEFNCNYIKFNKLLTQYPNYKYVSYLNIIAQLLQIINILYNLDINLKQQILIYEEELTNRYDRQNGVISGQKLDIVQDASIDLVYIQYLLLFDIEETGGLFIESNLIIARQVLEDNGGHIKCL